MKGWAIMRALALAALIGVLAPTPAAAQFSDSYKFLKAVRDKDGSKLMESMSQGGPNILNSRDYSTGEGGLQILAKRRDIEWLRFLLAKGADPNLRDNNGNTPLMAAAQSGFTDGIRLLTSVGASVNMQNDRGETPLILAVQRRDQPSVQALLAAGADPSITDVIAGMSAHDYAVRDTRSRTILELLDNAKKRPAPSAAEVAGPGL